MHKTQGRSQSRSRGIALVAARQWGITLLEVLLVVLLLSGGIAWALQVTVSNLKVAGQTHNTLLAVRGVQEYQLELLRSWDFATVATKDTGAWIPLTGADAPPALGNLTNGQAQYRVDPEPSSGNANLKRVTIQVQWTDPDGRARSSVVTTYIGNNGLTDPNPA